jgi:hypothetical protein
MISAGASRPAWKWRFFMSKAKICKEEESEKITTKYVAMVVRNEMEDFHCVHLSDKQMAELNPIIRNAIYTALVAIRECNKGNSRAMRFVDFHVKMIPEYWEEPKLSSKFEDFIRSKNP